MTTYYTKYRAEQTGATVTGLKCCAIGEVRLIEDAGGDPHTPPKYTVLQYIKQALYDKRTWVIFAFVKEYKQDEFEKKVKALECCTYMGEHKNPRTNRHVRLYLLNLKAEW